MARSTRRIAASSISTSKTSELKGFLVHRPFSDAHPSVLEGEPGELGFQPPLVTFAKTILAEHKDFHSAGYECTGIVYETLSEKYSYRSRYFHHAHTV